jgi:hypothetical protein
MPDNQADNQWLMVHPHQPHLTKTDRTGSGESLRGNINSFVDNLGSQGQNATNSGPSGTGNDVKDVEKDLENRATSAKGKEEMQAGLNAFQK